MKSLNRVTLMGNLVADPEVKQTPSGKMVAHFAIATNSRFKNKDGELDGKTDFHRIIAWEGLGRICGDYLKKGSGVYLEGKLNNRSYETNEGERKYLTEIVAKDVNILTWKKNKQGEPDAELQSISDDESEE